jgi:hypothetical protein
MPVAKIRLIIYPEENALKALKELKASFSGAGLLIEPGSRRLCS